MFSVRRSMSLKRPTRLVLCRKSPPVCKPSLQCKCNTGPLAQVESGATGCTREFLVVDVPSSRSTESPVMTGPQGLGSTNYRKLYKHTNNEKALLISQQAPLNPYLVGKRRRSCLRPSRRQGSELHPEAPRDSLLGTHWPGRVLPYSLMQNRRQHPLSQCALAACHSNRSQSRWPLPRRQVCRLPLLAGCRADAGRPRANSS